MTNSEKILLISAIDDMLIHTVGYDECFTNRERDEIAELAKEVYDMTAPKDIRERFERLARKLYAEITGDDE
jgi:hypothetical protein